MTYGLLTAAHMLAKRTIYCNVLRYWLDYRTLKLLPDCSSGRRIPEDIAVNTIGVGAAERPLADADPAWIRQQLNESLRKGGLPCVRVVVPTSNLNLVLQTRNCSPGSGGSRPPNGHEHEVLNL